MKKLKSKLFEMKQYQISGDKIFGGMPCNTDSAKGACDHWETIPFSTDFAKDVTLNDKGDSCPTPNNFTVNTSTSSAVSFSRASIYLG